MGMSYASPVRHMREYLTVLQELLAGRPAKFEGREYRVNVGLQVPGAKPVPVLVAALGEQMLRVCGRLAGGTILWMTGPKTIAQHVAPTLFAAAKEAGRPQPRIVANLPIALTTNRMPRASGSARTSRSTARFPRTARCSTARARPARPT